MKEDLIYISHILTAISDIKDFTAGMTKKDFFKNKMAEHAVVRNKVTHFYFGINYDIVWKVVKRDILLLEKNLKQS